MSVAGVFARPQGTTRQSLATAPCRTYTPPHPITEKSMSDYELEGKVAIVTGGAGGIGVHLSAEFAQAGAAVVVTSRQQEPLDEVVAKITADG
ncbi:MAG: SDR family NAD(P)-dependent oxidoreductase, partial [Pseudomonadales bacterium]|nr:SDR family NAD(P)-dependent oxidoreductase [Pseudomonadales bacterium]